MTQEAYGLRVEEPRPTAVDFAHEVVELWFVCFRVATGEPQFAIPVGGPGAEKTKSRNLCNSTLDLVPLNRAHLDRTVYGVGHSLPLPHMKRRSFGVVRKDGGTDPEASLLSTLFNLLSCGWET